MKIQEIRKISKEILSIKIKNNDTIKTIQNKFYRVMRKHSIKYGEKSENGEGIICTNPEWTICRELFMSQVMFKFMQYDLFEGVPKDLLHY